MSKHTTISLCAADVEHHRNGFRDWVNLEMDLGGPDPQVSLIVRMIKDSTWDLAERAWRAACWVSIYTVACGEMLWKELPSTVSDKEIRAAVDKVWPLLTIRMERRAIMSAPRLTRFLSSFRDWINDELFELDRADYEAIWNSAREHIHFSGRYSTIKVLEVLRRLEVVSAALPDLRPDGAWSPRLTLSFLRPDKDAVLNGGNSAETLAEVLDIFEDMRTEMNPFIGRPQPLDPFTFEVSLCNYRQSLKTKYPGRGHDSELACYKKTEPYWKYSGHTSAFLITRYMMWDRRCLGELHGWNAVRKEVGETIAQHGYYWSDLVYDYTRTTDLAHPVRWD